MSVERSQSALGPSQMEGGEPQAWAVGIRTGGLAASLPDLGEGRQLLGMFPERLACSGVAAA